MINTLFFNYYSRISTFYTGNSEILDKGYQLVVKLEQLNANVYIIFLINS